MSPSQMFSRNGTQTEIGNGDLISGCLYIFGFRDNNFITIGLATTARSVAMYWADVDEYGGARKNKTIKNDIVDVNSGLILAFKILYPYRVTEEFLDIVHATCSLLSTPSSRGVAADYVFGRFVGELIRHRKPLVTYCDSFQTEFWNLYKESGHSFDHAFVGKAVYHIATSSYAFLAS